MDGDVNDEEAQVRMRNYDVHDWISPIGLAVVAFPHKPLRARAPRDAGSRANNGQT